LLAKLPRSSKGSRELSASSSAAAFPADIFEVSIIGAVPDLAEDSFAPVSALICSGGASRGDFIFGNIGFQPLCPTGILPVVLARLVQRQAKWLPPGQTECLCSSLG